MNRPKIHDLVGKRFVNGGRDAIKGFDCWGLVMEVFRRYGITIPDFTIDAFSYQDIDKVTNYQMMSKQWKEVKRPFYDNGVPLVVLMRMHPKYIAHVGAYIGNDKIIHTMKATGVIISRASSLRNRIVGYYRYVDSNKHS